MFATNGSFAFVLLFRYSNALATPILRCLGVVPVIRKFVRSFHTTSAVHFLQYKIYFIRFCEMLDNITYHEETT